MSDAFRPLILLAFLVLSSCVDQAMEADARCMIAAEQPATAGMDGHAEHECRPEVLAAWRLAHELKR